MRTARGVRLDVVPTPGASLNRTVLGPIALIVERSDFGVQTYLTADEAAELGAALSAAALAAESQVSA